MSAAHVLLSSAKHDWLTPRWLVERIEMALGPIEMDPCASRSPHSAVKAARFACYGDETARADDGLKETWGCWRWFANPPYGGALPVWTRKILAEAEAGTEGVVLVPSRTETRWWGDLYDNAGRTLLLAKRVQFLDAETGQAVSGNTVGSTLFYFGSRCGVFARGLGDLGRIA